MSQVITCPDHQALAAYSLGQCLDADATILERHLSTCSHCLATLQRLQVSDTLVDALRAQTVVLERPRSDGPVEPLMDRLKTLYPAGQVRSDTLTFLKPPQTEEELGRLGHYRILDVLGSGGMGLVLRAEDTTLGRQVALKVLRPDLAESESARQRFLREARAAAALQHENIVPLHQVGECDGILYLSMPLLHGESLDARLKETGALPLAEVLEIGRQMAEGLAAAHAAGLIHRDIKPANVFLESSSPLSPCGRGAEGEGSSPSPLVGEGWGGGDALPFTTVKLLDFGLARPITDEAHLTGTGLLVGTPLYMAPEQAEGGRLDPRCDLFSLGSVLYTMATAQAPFRAETCLAVLREVCSTEPSPVHVVNPDMPSWLSKLIGKLLAKLPNDRFGSAREVADLLRQCADHLDSPASVPLPTELRDERPSRKPRRGWLALVAALVLVATGLGVAQLFGWDGWRQLPAILRVENPAPPPAPVAAQGAKAAGPEFAKSQHNSEPKVSPEQPIAAQVEEKGPTVYPVALLPFTERGVAVRDHGGKVGDLLFVQLAQRPEVTLVDRADLSKTLQELQLNLSGTVKPGEATRIGELTGAKILVTGSVIAVDKKIYLVAKIIGTETSRVLGASVDGKSSDELAPLVEKLAQQVRTVVLEQADKLVAKTVKTTDRIAALKKKLGEKKERPALYIQISERHVGAPRIDPAAETEFSKICKELGFTLIDPEEGLRSKADLLVTGEGFSELLTRTGNLVSVKARVEIKVVSRKTGETIAIDRQTALVVDLSEQIASKAALQQAAALLTERLIPQMVGK